jgi:uncharacterized membrane protein
VHRNQALVVGLVLVLVAAGISALYYGRVPPLMPSHWNAAGQINGYMPRLSGVLLLPSIMAVVWILLYVLPLVSPRQFGLEASIGAFNLIVVGILTIFLALHVVILVAASGAQIRMQTVVPALVGVMLVFIGNYMGKLRKNFFIGVRTPWTLASDEVWVRTHRLAGWTFSLGGIALIVQSLLGSNPGVFVAIVSIVVVLPIAYSFVIYKHIEGFGPDGS